LLLLGIYLLWESAGYARMARAFPRLILLLMVALIVLDLAWDFYRARRGARSGDADELFAQLEAAARHRPLDAAETGSTPSVRVLGCVALMVAYPSCLYLVGFLPSSLLFFPLAAWCLGYREGRQLALSSVVVVGFLYVVFVLIMDSRLPTGLLVRWVSG
jgi:hypothetical protein